MDSRPILQTAGFSRGCRNRGAFCVLAVQPAAIRPPQRHQTPPSRRPPASQVRSSLPRPPAPSRALSAPSRRPPGALQAPSAPSRRPPGALPAPSKPSPAPWSSCHVVPAPCHVVPAPPRRPPLPAHPPPAPPSRTRQVAHDVCHTPSNKPCNPPNSSNKQKTCKPPVPYVYGTLHIGHTPMHRIPCNLLQHMAKAPSAFAIHRTYRWTMTPVTYPRITGQTYSSPARAPSSPCRAPLPLDHP